MLWRRRIARSWPAAGEHAINYLVLLGRKCSTASIVYYRMAWAACVHVLLRLHVLLRCALNEVCGAWAMAAAVEAAVAGTRSTGRKGRALLRQE